MTRLCNSSWRGRLAFGLSTLHGFVVYHTCFQLNRMGQCTGQIHWAPKTSLTSDPSIGGFSHGKKRLHTKTTCRPLDKYWSSFISLSENNFQNWKILLQKAQTNLKCSCTHHVHIRQSLITGVHGWVSHRDLYVNPQRCSYCQECWFSARGMYYTIPAVSTPPQYGMQMGHLHKPVTGETEGSPSCIAAPPSLPPIVNMG